MFLIVIAGGVLAYGIHDLQEAGILPGLNNLAFDVSATIPPSSILGTLLKGVFNFSPATTWLEAIAWVAVRRADDVPVRPDGVGLCPAARARDPVAGARARRHPVRLIA